MAYTLLYVSRTLLNLPGDEPEVRAIVDGSVQRNASLGVTGALISTGQHFAQVLEGERAAVEELMRSIDADPRHMRIRIVRVTEEKRRFTGWAMAYSGYAGFVDRQIVPLMATLPEADRTRLGLKLISVMEEFSRLPQV